MVRTSTKSCLLSLALVSLAVVPLRADDSAASPAPDGVVDATADAGDAASTEVTRRADELLAAFRKIDFVALRKSRTLATDDAARGTILEAEWYLSAHARDLGAWLAPLLADENRDVRALAALGAGLSGSDDLRAVLLERCAVENDAIAHRRVIEALGRLGGDEALAAVEACQKKTTSKDVKAACALARRQLKGGAWDLESVRGEAADALRGTPGAVEPKVGERAPELAAPSKDGVVNLSALEGQVVVVAFIWGENEREDARVLSRLVREQPRLTRDKVEVVIVVPGEKERAEDVRRKLNLPFRVAADPMGRAANSYGVARRMLHGSRWMPVPAWFIVGKDGDVWWKRVGKKAGDHASLGMLLPALDSTCAGARPKR